MVRGNGDAKHGEKVFGGHWFLGESDTPWSWAQGGGINAGVILLRPCEETLRRMVAEVTSDEHPEHICGPGPEQDYLSRYFASKPWRHIDVKWNYQVHHVPFALERVIQWYKYDLERYGEVPEEDRRWRPPRLRTEADDIGIVHFSGDVKLWHIVLDSVQNHTQRRAVEHRLQSWGTVEDFSEHLIKDCCEGYSRWCLLAAAPEEYATHGCVVLANNEGPRRLVVQPGGTCEGSEDVTALAQEVFDHLRVVVHRATTAWQVCAEALLAQCPPALLEELVRPTGPAGSIPPGERVEVRWPPEAVPDANAMWLTAIVVSVHADGRHVVRYDRGGDWGDTERGVVAERIRRVSSGGKPKSSSEAEEPSEASA